MEFYIHIDNPIFDQKFFESEYMVGVFFKNSFFAIVLLVFMSLPFSSFGQGLSTEGKDFWVGYLTNWNPSANNPVILELYISADDTTSGTVTMPRQSSFAAINFVVYPNAVRKITIPTNLAMASGSNLIENKGLHIETDNNVSVYAMNKRQYSADMTVILPTYSLGNNYFVLSHWEDGNRNNNDNSDSEFLILGITDSTEVEITPTVATINGNPPNVPFRVTLFKGQTYQLRAKSDLTGSQIVATNKTGCRNFAVFSGNMYTQVGECNVDNGHDHLYAQMYPTNTLGKEFIVVPLENRYGGDIIKFLATQDNTTITSNNNTYHLNAGEFIKILSASVLNVKSDKPIAIGQYSRTMDCDGTLGDPFLIPISPNEQLLKKITFNAPSIATLSIYSLNIITKKEDVSLITFDGAPIGNAFNSISGNDEYVYAQINTTGGNHTIRSNGGFIAYVYGFGHNESFGYATGASLGNLNIEFLVKDQNEETPIDSLCLGSEIYFQVISDTIYTLFNYDFGDGHSLVTSEDTAVSHQYNQPGEYLVSLTASTGGDDCSSGNEETSLKIIRVIEPYAKIYGPRSVCPNTSDVEYFLDEYNPNDIDWFVSGGLLKEPTNQNAYIDWSETNNNAQIKVIATNRYGCIADTIVYPVKINIQLDPEAPFGPDTLCSNDVTGIPYETYFTNVSTYEWKTDFGNISDGNGTNMVNVDWNGYGNGNLWFDQISVTDTICDGTSDILDVYIQRNPSEIGNIVLEKDTFLMGEPIHMWLDVDTLYQFANWELDDGIQFDTLNVTNTIDHIFQCEGLHKIIAIAYDTGTVCSDTKVIIEKNIFIKPPSIEIINVSKSTSQTDALDINWIMENESFFPKELFLYRRKAGSDSWQFIATLYPDQTSYTDTDIEVFEASYEYKIETNLDCENPISSSIHQSILLSSESEDTTAMITWNDYFDWENGVDHYEIWLSVDSSDYQLLETTSDLQYNFSYKNKGFDHCFFIRAMERNGNNSNSVSNTTCVEFIPKIHTYNVITPNTDQFNEYFTIDNIEHYPNSKLTILNRNGKIVYETIGYKNNWNGRINGKTASSGTYYYELELNEPRNELNSIRGYFSILY